MYVFFFKLFKIMILSYDFLFMMLGPLVPAVTGWWFSFRNYHPTSPLRYQLNWHPFTGWHNIGHDESKWPQKGAQKRDSMGILYTIYPFSTFNSPIENKWPYWPLLIINRLIWLIGLIWLNWLIESIDWQKKLMIEFDHRFGSFTESLMCWT